ncbi:MAG: RNA-binding S4 domain-containing protein [Steroidobacteraceae bacterium]
MPALEHKVSIGESLRIDRWLFAVRLYKSRSLAAAAVSGGKVHVNGERVKPARAVRPGDRLSLTRGAVDFECEVTALPARRGPHREAVMCYRESPESIARREAFAERVRLSGAFAPRPQGRPDKHERQALRRIRGRE